MAANFVWRDGNFRGQSRPFRRWRVAFWALSALLVTAYTPLTPTPPTPASAAVPIDVAAAIGLTPREATTTLSAQFEDGRMVIDIFSTTGIGSAKIDLPHDFAATRMPVQFRLHTAGLEEFQFHDGTTTTLASVSARGSRQQIQEGELPASAIGPDSPYWLPIRAPSTIPAGPDEYFLIDAPSAFHTGPQRVIDVGWIDFFR